MAGAGELTIVVLAAGRSSRFGSNKLLCDIGGETLLDRTLRACGSYPVIVIASPELADRVATAGKPFVVNDAPERGMAHSLRLANALVDAASSIAVLPADLLHVTAAGVTSILECSRDVDVTMPMRADGTPGHPVVFSAAARRYIDELPDGDTIRRMRDRPELTRRIVSIEDEWPYHDVDTPSDLPSERPER